MTTETQTASTNIFELASRKSLRFETSKGMLFVEDLWTLPLTSETNRVNLNGIAQGLHAKIEATTQEFSLAPGGSKPDSDDQLMFDIVKHIYGVRSAENEARRTAAKSKEREQYLLGLLSKKKSEKDETMTVEEIEKALAEINATA